jgi:TetR/AcrR family transcriptional regulator of autoinduction and epiphytic fitness
MAKVSFKEQVLRTREDAIVTAANRLLAEKGFDLMTVDEVAAEVGIAKASLYKHFASKEALAAAAMVRLMERALVFVRGHVEPKKECALACLKLTVKWALEVQLAGEMPSLPAQNSSLRTFLMNHPPYRDRLVELSEHLGGWIVAAQGAGDLHPGLPAEVILYTLFAKACDPVLEVMKASANFSDEIIVGMLLQTCFGGLIGPGPGPGPASPQG